MDKKFDLNDIVLVPAEESNIVSRSECDVYTSTWKYWDTLPLIASPMDTVVSLENCHKYTDNHIIPCIPRNIKSPNNFITFKSFGISEIELMIDNYKVGIVDNTESFYNYNNVLIDIANGHMRILLELVKEIKTLWPEVHLMVGNIANPETFVNLGLAGADFIRCSVGTGAGCTTAANVSINYPLGSLISECYKLKQQYKLETKIVADGGMNSYADIIKALGLGANYIMCGSIFNKSIESAGFNYLWKIKINNKMAEFLWRWGFPIKKKYRGMSTKAVQRSWGKSKLVTAEGITKYQNVEYTLHQWTENFKDYLRSAMSYCNAKTLDDFIGKVNYVHITENARKRFQK